MTEKKSKGWSRARPKHPQAPELSSPLCSPISPEREEEMSRELGLTSTRGTWTSPNPQFHSIFDEFNAEPEELSCSPSTVGKFMQGKSGNEHQRSGAGALKRSSDACAVSPSVPQPLPSVPTEHQRERGGSRVPQSAPMGIPSEPELTRRVALSSSRTPSPARTVRETNPTVEASGMGGEREREKEREKGKESLEGKGIEEGGEDIKLSQSSTWIKHKRSSGNKESDPKRREKESSEKSLEQRKTEEEINDSKRKMQAAGSSTSERLRDYQLGNELGRGAFGVVFKGIHVRTGDIVAIKRLNVSNIKPEKRHQVTREVELLEHLTGNEHIVKYLGTIQDDAAELNIVLEYVEGGSLHEIMRKFGVFPESLAKVYIRQILEGLAYLHSQDVLHRDIKGANVLLTKTGICKLADFGTSIMLDAVTKHYSCVGTPYWMAPEVLDEGVVTETVDIWSLGCTLIELLTGKPPYFDLGPMAAMFRISEDPHPPIPENITEQLEHFLHCCLQKDPELRCSATQLLLHPWLESALPLTRERAPTILEAASVLQEHNTRSGISKGIHFYEDALIIGQSYREANIHQMLEQLDAAGDPPNILQKALEDIEERRADADAKAEAALKRATERERKDSEDGGDDSGGDGEVDTSGLSLVLKELELVREENKLLLATGAELRKQVGMVLSEKKKVLALARKLEEKADEATRVRKNAVAELQSFKDRVEKSTESPETVALRHRELQLRAGIEHVSSVATVGALTASLFQNLSVHSIRADALEGWMNIVIAKNPQAFKDKSRKRCLFLLRNNFLFYYTHDTSEAPLGIVQVERYTVVEVSDEKEMKEDTKLREEIGQKNIVEREVLRWLGGDEEVDQKGKKKKKRRYSSRDLAKKSKEKEKEPPSKGRFKFMLESPREAIELGFDSSNSKSMWMTALASPRMWFESFKA